MLIKCHLVYVNTSIVKQLMTFAETLNYNSNYLGMNEIHHYRCL